jgi:hypothetical protein
MNSLEQTEQALFDLLNSVDITPSDVEGVDVYDLPPSNLTSPNKIKIVKNRTYTAPKYVSMAEFKTKEQKMQFVLSQMLTITAFDKIMALTKQEIMTIDYARPYKDSISGPVIMVGEPSKDCKNKGRTCFREINGRFPITDMLEKIKEYL